MDWFAAVHSWLFLATLLSPWLLPQKWHIYIYYYLCALLIMWLLLSRCPLFFIRDEQVKKDDLVIHLDQLGLINKDKKDHEAIVRLFSGIAPVPIILWLGYYPKATWFLSALYLLVVYRRYLNELV